MLANRAKVCIRRRSAKETTPGEKEVTKLRSATHKPMTHRKIRVVKSKVIFLDQETGVLLLSKDSGLFFLQTDERFLQRSRILIR